MGRPAWKRRLRRWRAPPSSGNRAFSSSSLGTSLNRHSVYFLNANPLLVLVSPLSFLSAETRGSHARRLPSVVGVGQPQRDLREQHDDNHGQDHYENERDDGSVDVH